MSSGKESDKIHLVYLILEFGGFRGGGRGGGLLFCRGPLVTGVKVAHLLETLTTVEPARLNWVASIVSVDFLKTFVPHCESHAVACRSLFHAKSMRKVLHDALPLFRAPCLKVGFNRPKERGGRRKKTIVI